MKTIHELKTIPCFFNQTWDKQKAFEIRKCEDRTFQKGDIVILKEYSRDSAVLERWCYSGREIKAVISFVTGYEQKENVVVFGLKDLKNKSKESK